MGRKATYDQIKLQVPIDKSVHQGLEKRAAELGFDSVQAYIRFWAKAQAGDQDTSRAQTGLRKPDAQALRYLELLLVFNKKESASVEEALEYVLKQLQNIKLGKYLEQLFKT